MNDIISRIDELRIMRGLSKAALAEKIGVTPTTISNWSKMDSMPSLAVVERVCDATGVTVEQFFSGLGSNKQRQAETVFIDKWRMLTDIQKTAIEQVIDVFINSK